MAEESGKKITKITKTTYSSVQLGYIQKDLDGTEQAYIGGKKVPMDEYKAFALMSFSEKVKNGYGLGKKTTVSTTTTDNQTEQKQIIVGGDEERTLYGTLPSDYKQTEEEAIKLAEEWQQSKKTPAPAELTETTKNAYKQLIEANPPDEKSQENIKQIKEKFSDITTKDGTPLGSVIPKSLNELPEEAQKKAIEFKNALNRIPIPDSLTTGKLIIQADPFKDTTLDTMQAKIENTFKELKSPLAAGNSAMDISASLKNASDALSGQMGGMVTNMTEQLTNKIMGSVNAGLIAEQDRINNLSDDDFANEFSGQFSDRLKAVKAFQKPFFVSGESDDEPGILDNLLNTMGCEPSQIRDALPGVFNDLLGSAVGNAVNTPPCAGQQIIGAATNKVVNMIDSIIKPKLEGLENTLNFKLDVKDMLFSGLDMSSMSSKIPELNNVCGTKSGNPSSSAAATNKFVLGQGPKLPSSVAKIQDSFNEILDSSAIKNKASSMIGQVSGVVDQVSDQVSEFQKEYGSWNILGGASTGGTPLDNCNTGPVESSGPPKVEAFGGGGSGLKAEVILGDYVDKLNNDDIFASAERTASIVGVRIIDSGRGYTSPPIVTFDDEIGQGYGAYGKATIDQNPDSSTYGQVTSIYITSKGENYPASDEEDPMYIVGVVIDDPGLGYEDTDTLEDFELTVVDGQIVNVNVVTPKSYNDLPELNINTTTGFGAKLRPLLTLIPPAQGEVIQVIDCIGKV